MQKIEIKNLQDKPINFLEIDNENLVFTCTDNEIISYNLATSSKQFIFKSGSKNNDNEEFSCLKLINGHLFGAQENILLVFDVQSSKQINKFKFFKETINAIEINASKSLLACCDDTGKINLLDFKYGVDTKQPCLTLKKSLNEHKNICSSLKFNPNNEYELFSGSFDCTVLKWDIRFVKSSSNQSFLKKIDISETLSKLNETNAENDLISSMTPCFVHTLNITNSLLLCGIENGLCMFFNALNGEYVDRIQMQSLNCALTQIENVDPSINIPNEANSHNLTIFGGNGKMIEFLKIENSSKLEKLESLRIDHGQKINCMKVYKKKLYVADTSPNLTIYDLNF